jgi:phosphoglycolate phosphatase
VSNTIFFDLDGTLTDPLPGITKSIQYAMRKLDRAVPTVEELTWCIGPPLQSSLEELVGAEQSLRALKYFRERFSDIGWQENEPYEGIHEVLAGLRDSGRQLFVATSKPGVYARRIIDHFDMGRYFDAVFGSELDGTRTDKAELLRYACEQSSTADGATMVGDRRHDVIGARANRMKVVGVAYGYGSVDELQQAGADIIVHSLQELPGVLLE